MAENHFKARTVSYSDGLLEIHPAAEPAHGAWLEGVPAFSHLEGIRLLRRDVADDALLCTPLRVVQTSNKPRRYGVLADFGLFYQIVQFKPKSVALLVLKPTNFGNFSKSARILEPGGNGHTHQAYAAIFRAHQREKWDVLQSRMSLRRMAQLLGCTVDKIRIRMPRS